VSGIAIKEEKKPEVKNKRLVRLMYFPFAISARNFMKLNIVYLFWPRAYVDDVKEILSRLRDTDLDGLNITVVPMWHPASMLLNLDASGGYEDKNGIIIGAYRNRQDFRRVFIHELTHWLLRKNPRVEFLLAQNHFEHGHMHKGYFPSPYATVNSEEYAAELGAYAFFYIKNDEVITASQREIIAQLYNTDVDHLYFSQPDHIEGRSILPYAVGLSGLAHTAVLTYGSSYFYYVAALAGIFLFNSFSGSLPTLKKTFQMIPVKLPRKVEKFSRYFLLASLVYFSYEFLPLINNVYTNEKQTIPLISQKAGSSVSFIPVDVVGKPLPPTPSIGQYAVEEDGISIDNKWAGNIPVIDTGDPTGFLSYMAMLYRYYKIDKPVSDIVNSWKNYDELRKSLVSIGPWPEINYGNFKIRDNNWNRFLSFKISNITRSLRNHRPVIAYEKNTNHAFLILGISGGGLSFGGLIVSTIDFQVDAFDIKTKKISRRPVEDFGRFIFIIPEQKDHSMIIDSDSGRKRGGIDLTSDKALTVQNNGQGIKFHLDPAQLQELQNAPGFVPVIINIRPMTDLRKFLDA